MSKNSKESGDKYIDFVGRKVHVNEIKCYFSTSNQVKYTLHSGEVIDALYKTTEEQLKDIQKMFGRD